jgi:hypothetical protein
LLAGCSDEIYAGSIFRDAGGPAFVSAASVAQELLNCSAAPAGCPEDILELLQTTPGITQEKVGEDWHAPLGAPVLPL